MISWVIIAIDVRMKIMQWWWKEEYTEVVAKETYGGKWKKGSAMVESGVGDRDSWLHWLGSGLLEN